MHHVVMHNIPLFKIRLAVDLPHLCEMITTDIDESVLIIHIDDSQATSCTAKISKMNAVQKQ